MNYANSNSTEVTRKVKGYSYKQRQRNKYNILIIYKYIYIPYNEKIPTDVPSGKIIDSNNEFSWYEYMSYIDTHVLFR